VKRLSDQMKKIGSEFEYYTSSGQLFYKHTHTRTHLFSPNCTVLMLKHVSAANRNCLQEATVREDTRSVLCNLTALNGELYTCGTIQKWCKDY
jgi:hypothetical protein